MSAQHTLGYAIPIKKNNVTNQTKTNQPVRVTRQHVSRCTATLGGTQDTLESEV